MTDDVRYARDDDDDARAHDAHACSTCAHDAHVHNTHVHDGDDVRVPYSFLYINAVVLFDFAHYEGALNGTDIVDVAQFVEHKLLILLHVACAYF